jgi:cysteine desulfurase
MPQLFGGGQQDGLRPGTIPLALTVGLGMACHIGAAEMLEESARMRIFTDQLFSKLTAEAGEVSLNGTSLRRLTSNLSLSIAGVDAHQLLAQVPELAISVGSACASMGRHPSYVLQALGLSDDEIRSTIRVSTGRFTTAAEIERSGDLLVAAIRNLRARPATC